MASYKDTVLALNPVAYWRLGEASGTVAVDEIGSYDGTYVNTPTLGVDGLLVGDSDTAVSFINDTSDAVNLPSPMLPNSSADFSISLVFNISSYIEDTTLLSQYEYQTDDRFILGVKLNKITVWFGSLGNVLESTSNILAGDTHIITVTRLNQVMYLYVDGLLEDFASNSISFIIADTMIGGLLPYISSTFNGTIDEVAIYNTALTQEQVTTLYRASKAYAFDISIDHTKVPEDLYDFPLLVNLGATSGIDAFDSSVVFDELAGSVAHRYWRLYVTANNGSGNYTGVSELEFHESIGGSDVSVPSGSGNIITESSFFGAGYEGTQLFNNIDTEHGWITTDGLMYPSWVEYDTNTLSEINVVEFSLKSTVYTDRTPKDFSLQYSDNGADWIDVIVVVDQTGWSTNEIRTFSLSSVANTNLLTAVYKNPADNTYPASVDDDFTGNDGDSPDRDLWNTSGVSYISSNSIFLERLGSGDAGLCTSVYKLNGDCQIEVDLTSHSIQAVSSGYVELGFLGSEDTKYSIFYYYGTSSFKVQSGQSGTQGTLTDGVITLTLSTTKFRLTRVGSFYTAYYFDSIWVQLGIGLTITGLGDLKPRLAVSSWADTPDTSANFDNFTVNSGTIVWPDPVDTSVISQQCKVEIDRWDQVNQQAQLWLKVPYISADVDTIINLSYDSTNADNSDNIGETGTLPARLVWSEYDAVYHLSKDGADSAANSLDGTLEGGIDSTNIVDFGIGKGMTFDGVGEYIELPDLTIGVNGAITLEGIAQTTNSDLTESARILELNSPTETDPLVILHYSVDEYPSLYVIHNTISQDFKGDALDVSNIHHVTGVSTENSNALVYIDSVIDTSTTDTAGSDDYHHGYTASEQNSRIGSSRHDAPLFFMDGKLKEIRFAKNLKSAGWVASNYDSTQDTLVRYEHIDSFLLDKIISGTITETLAVTQWLIRSYDYATGALVASMVSPNGAFELSIPVGYWTPQSVTISPDQGIVWAAEVAKDVGDLVFPTDPVTTPYYFQCTVSGTVGDGVTDTTEPDFNSNTLPGNTVVDGTVTWEVVERMIQPITHSPLIPI